MDRVAAIVLAGGTAVRLDGADKASVEIGGRTLLERCLGCLAGADEVVVVGDAVPTSLPVTFTREDPALGGPVAGLVAGVAALAVRPDALVVLAVDMARVSADTVARLLAAAGGRDGAFLHDGSGRRRLAGVLGASALGRLPGADEAHGASMGAALAGLDLAQVAAVGDEASDLNTWTDVRRLRDASGPAS